MDTKQLSREASDVVPEEIAPFVRALIEGRVKQIAIIAEMDDGNVADTFAIIDPNANRFSMIGAMQIQQRDYLRCHIRSRVEYMQEGGDE